MTTDVTIADIDEILTLINQAVAAPTIAEQDRLATRAVTLLTERAIPLCILAKLGIRLASAAAHEAGHGRLRQLANTVPAVTCAPRF